MNAVCARLDRYSPPASATTPAEVFTGELHALQQALSALKALRPPATLAGDNARVVALDTRAVNLFASLTRQVKAGTITPAAAAKTLDAVASGGAEAQETALWKKLGVTECENRP